MTHTYPPSFSLSPTRPPSGYSQTDAHITPVIIAVLKWTKPRALRLDVSNGIGWLTSTVIPLTKHDALRATHVSWDTHEMLVGNHGLPESWSPIKILSALRGGVGGLGSGSRLGSQEMHVFIMSYLSYWCSLWLREQYGSSWKSTHRGCRLIIHQGCCQVSSHIVQHLEKYSDLIVVLKSGGCPPVWVLSFWWCSFAKYRSTM